MNEFERASQHAGRSMAGELWYFLRQSRKWWLLPVLIAFVLFALLVMLSSTAAAPFIYTLF